MVPRLSSTAVMLAAILGVIIVTVEIFGSRTESTFATAAEKLASIVN